MKLININYNSDKIASVISSIKTKDIRVKILSLLIYTLLITFLDHSLRS